MHDSRGKKRSVRRLIVKLVAWVVFVIVALFGLQVTVLAFPQILLHDKASSGTVTLYHDGLTEDEAQQLAEAVDFRLSGSSLYESIRSDRVFYFTDEGLYKFVVRLTLQKDPPQGFNLSIFGNSYVCEPIVRNLGQATGGRPRYSIWEGDPSHTIAHEIGHQYVVDRIGRRKLPHWKQEGLCEYTANIGLVRADSSACLASRIALLENDTVWLAVPAGRRPGWDRVHYEAGLLVEYMLDIEGLAFDQLIEDSVTKEAARSAMMTWYRGQI
jgi:hypothetical protein